MDFDLSPDQLALRDAAAAVLGDLADSARVRTVVDEPDGDRVDVGLWKAMLDQGWPLAAVPESAGGLGLGWVEAAVLLERVGAYVAPAPVLGTLVALDALARAGRNIDLGEGWAAVASTGGREVVASLPGASLVVAVRGDELIATEPTAVEPVAALDRTRGMAWFDPAGVTGADVLGGADAVERHRQVGALAHAAELLGCAQRMLDVSVAYAKDRVQFGRPIGSFQAVKHRCADMLVDVEGMRSTVWWAAWCVATGHRDAGVAVATTKSWCSQAGVRVCESALQVHGGIGFTWDCDVHLYLKRARFDADAFGTASHHLSALAGLLRSKVEAGESVL
ncbi:MAG: acyl-CoA dehydrogenase family protein [Acidimicrobiales bacterium]